MSGNDSEHLVRTGNVGRRGFLRGAAVAGVAGMTLSTADAQPPTPGRWDLTADLLVVGSGAAGYAAACTAASKGLSVIMFEKGAIYGGTTAKSGAQYWIPNNSMMRRLQMRDPEEWALKLMARLSWPTFYDPESPTLGLTQHNYDMIRTYYRRGPEAIDYLADQGALKPVFASFLAMTGVSLPESEAASAWPDYAADLPECKAPVGRTLTALNGGGALIKTFKTYADGKGVKLLTDHQVDTLYRNTRGEVFGLATKSGETRITARARRGVFFGSGGFTHNVEMRNNHLRGFVFNGCAVPTNTGDLIPLALELKAKPNNMNNAWWHEQPLEVALTVPGVSSDVFYIPGDSAIEVNRYGARCVNEKIVYNERAQVHFIWDAVLREYPNFITFMIYDEATATRDHATYTSPTYPIPQPGVDAPYVIKGRDIDELAANVATRLASLKTHTGGFTLDAGFADGLRATMKRFNGFALTGKDLDFHRGDSPQQLNFSGPGRPNGNMKNPTMHPLSETGPYYCIPLVAATLDTKGGPKTDSDSRVLDVDDKPIVGLYGAGNCVASPAAQAYWSGGATIGCAIVFGYLAALHASGRAPMID